MGKLRWFGSILFSLTLLAAACTSDGQDSGGENGGGGGGQVVEGGILRMGSTSTIDSLNPFKAFNQDAYIAFFYIYPYLVQYDENLESTGDFATDWEVSPDATTLTFHTQEGGAWSDGEPLTADDVAYTLNLILRFPGPTGIMAGYAKHIDAVDAPDPNTVVIHYEQPVNTEWALSQLALLPMLPEHVWSQHEGNDGRDLRTFTNEAPIVSGGPFVLQEYEKRDIAQFTANAGYYGPKPHIDGFGMKFYTNSDAMVSALQNGDLDAVETIPPNAYDALKGNPNLVVTEVPGMYFDEFIINSNKPLHAELLDPKVRQAFAHAIDTQQMVDVVLGGRGEVATTIVPPATGKWHNPNIEPVPTDIEAANTILDDLGFKRGPDGVRVANGHKMEYEVVTPNDAVGINREFQVIQAGLEQIGVNVSQKSLDPDATFVAIAGEDYVSYDSFDLAIWYWFPTMDPDFILSVLTCEQLGFWSDSGYCNEEYDRLYEKQGVTVDSEKRKEIVWEMQQIIFDDKPYIMLQYRRWIEAHAANWDGFVITPQGSLNILSKATLLQVHQVG